VSSVDDVESCQCGGFWYFSVFPLPVSSLLSMFPEFDGKEGS